MTLSETQGELVALAARILDDAAARSTPPVQVWRLLADAGLLGIGVPEELGGLGLGFAELGLVLEAAGRTAASVPLLEGGVATTVLRDLGVGPARDALLRELASGEALFRLALSEPAGDPFTPLVCADGDPGRWTLDGTKLCPPSDLGATHLLVSAHLAGVGPRLLLLGVGRDGVNLASGTVTFDGVPVGFDDVLGDLAGPGAVPFAVQFAVRCATAAACSVMAGAAAEALRLTAEYVRTREQFERPLGSFQAVGQRAADAFTAAWSIELTARQACWHLDSDTGPDADRAVAVAKYTAATAGTAVVRAAHHLHGGIGLDRDYPLHRFTTLSRRLGLLLGGASEQVSFLGDLLASETVALAAPTGSA